MRREYRTPDGAITTSAEKYCDAWDDLADVVTAIDPDLELYAFGPDLAFRKGNLTLELPVWFVWKLSDYLVASR